MNLLVSIVVPIYNVEKYLNKSLDSIVSQTYTNLDIILVDDGSTDNSYSIMQEYAKKDNRVQCIRKVNGGLSSARNNGMQYIKGEYVFFVDSDDFIELNTIELLINRAIDVDADIAICDMSYLYDDGSKTFASGGDFEVTSFKDDSEIVFINNSACNKLVHRNLLDNFIFPEGLWYEDLGSIPILLAKAKRIVKVNKPLYNYYQRSGSIAHSTNMKIFDIYKAISIVEKEIGSIIKRMYVIHGLDLTTLRIKEFDQKEIRREYLKKNMELLNKYYSSWDKDECIKKYSIKKKIMFKLLKHGKYDMVLKMFDR